MSTGTALCRRRHSNYGDCGPDTMVMWPLGFSWTSLAGSSKLNCHTEAASSHVASFERRSYPRPADVIDYLVLPSVYLRHGFPDVSTSRPSQQANGYAYASGAFCIGSFDGFEILWSGIDHASILACRSEGGGDNFCSNVNMSGLQQRENVRM